MARYLSPSKIALLALIATYTEGVVPHSGTIPVLSFLVSHLLHDNLPDSERSTGSSDHAVPIEAFEKSLASVQSAFPGRSVWDLFLKKIWMLDCSDALDSFITNIRSVLAKTKEELANSGQDDPNEDLIRLSRTSPLGAFIRRAHLEYTRLQIHDAIRLWETFIVYRLPSKQAWEKRNPTETRNNIDVNLSNLEIDSSSTLARVVYRNLVDSGNDEGGYSTFDVERLLEFQVSEMQRLGSRLPDETRTRLSRISRMKSSKPSLLHYLTFLDSWRAGDYASAFDNLHRYFDYSMQSRDRTFYQYALLNLAILQADFGCYSEAIPAMQEAIATARENKDVSCLNFCMSWLYHFDKAFPEETMEIHKSGMLGSEAEVLNFLKSKAKEAEMWSLLSTTLLSETKLNLRNGESIATAFENLAKSAHLNVTKNVTSVVGPNLILRSSICSRIGLSRLAWSSCETFMECYSADAPMEDTLKALCRMSNMLSQQGAFEHALEMLANVTDYCGPHVLRVLNYYQYWVFFSGLVKFRRFLHRHDLNAAEYILSQLKAQGAPDIEVAFTFSVLEIEYFIVSANYPSAISTITQIVESNAPIVNDIFAQIKFLNLKALTLCRSGNPTHAFSIAVRAATMANRTRILPALWEAIATLSEILISLYEFSAATALLEAILPASLETLDNTLTARVYSLLVDATMGRAGQTATSTTSTTTPVRTHPSSTSTSPQAKSKSKAKKQTPTTTPSKSTKPTIATADASISIPQNRKSEELMNEALDLLESAFEKYEDTEDWKGMLEMMAKRATVFKALGDHGACELASQRYLDLRLRWKEVLVE